MDWEQKLYALNAIGEARLCMREPGDWYVDQRTEIGAADSGMLTGSYGNGATPKDAVLDHWRELVDDLPARSYIVLSAMDDERRRHVRWNGFMWIDVPRERGLAGKVSP